jgi:hypothetical protein
MGRPWTKGNYPIAVGMRFGPVRNQEDDRAIG